MFIKNKLPGFTLLESLVALLVITGSILVYNVLTKSVMSEVTNLSVRDEQSWLLFSHQLWSELEDSQLVRVENNHLYIKRDGKLLSLGKSKGDDFRKTDAIGRGYQPLLYNVSSSRIEVEGQRVEIKLHFMSGMERVFIYEFKKTD
ncbi:MAG: competence type IV pilus minor pilin ComGF [Streptococcus sp.]|nr:competence type IV pilus minor pilin ComGF [Streptococcus sp.]